MTLLSPDGLKVVDRALTPVAVTTGRAIAALARRRPPIAGPLLAMRPGGMGDLIAAQIAVEDLGRDPRRDVRWVVERRSAPWARLQGLDHLVYDEHPAGVLRAVAGRYAVVLNTEQRFGLSQALARAAVARNGRLLAPSTNRGAARSGEAVAYDPYDEHETIAFARLFAAAWGVAPDQVDGHPERRARAQPSDGTLLVAISGRQSPTRAMSAKAWAALVRAWSGDRSVTIVGAPIDDAFADQLAALIGPSAVRLGLDFDGLCARIAVAEGLFTVDGGPVHIASWYGTPTRAVFTSGREGKWAPLGAGSEIVRTSGLACQPCTLFGQTPPCPNRLICHGLDAVADVRACANYLPRK